MFYLIVKKINNYNFLASLISSISKDILNAKEHVAPKVPGKDNSNAKWEKTKDKLHINVHISNSVTNDATIVVPHLLKNLIILSMIV